MVLDIEIERVIGDKSYTFKLPIKMLFKAERELTRKSMILTMANLPLCLEDLYILLKYSLKGGQPNMTESEIEDVYYQAIDEMGLPELQNFVLEILEKSAAFGKSKKM